MKGKINGSFYALDSSTISSSVNVSISTIHDDETELWHLRSSNMSEKDMFELSKEHFLGGKKLSSLKFVSIALWKAQDSEFQTGNPQH
jgi:gag-pre-integrase-like protein